ncbi:hypothetical protein PV08_11592 [Exophiala spinifera]|uniref:SMODS and SLOG-associating 2TM effector domain-containing protein n=1 Tax=Exophiala spinifera TaxID=91928 RepID=A0A0D2AV84_9EURO|nr:uncharacterized protein PV08_11592 [Exophiala spinifera]KIW10628.1 hypothetical protein PV08_11592 [Exophiala spinifera]
MSAPVAVTTTLFIAFAAALGRNFDYESQRWGFRGRILGLFRLVDTNAARQLHWNINTWTDDEVMAWKQSCISNCTAIQVAGAIFASVGLTALQLPNMDSSHWSARALLSCSMILGVLSVVQAASLQQHISVLNRAFDIRLWLSRGKIETDKTHYRRPFHYLPLESSVATLKQFSMPKALLNWAVLLYTVGFGIYLLFAWIYHVESEGGRNDFRNVFMSFVATVGVVYVSVFVVDMFAIADERKRVFEFDLNRTTTFAKPVSQKQLEEWLAALQDMQNTTVGSGELYARLETAVEKLQSKWDAERRLERLQLKRELRRQLTEMREARVGAEQA